MTRLALGALLLCLAAVTLVACPSRVELDAHVECAPGMRMQRIHRDVRLLREVPLYISETALDRDGGLVVAALPTEDDSEEKPWGLSLSFIVDGTLVDKMQVPGSRSGQAPMDPNLDVVSGEARVSWVLWEDSTTDNFLFQDVAFPSLEVSPVREMSPPAVSVESTNLIYHTRDDGYLYLGWADGEGLHLAQVREETGEVIQRTPPVPYTVPDGEVHTILYLSSLTVEDGMLELYWWQRRGNSSESTEMEHSLYRMTGPVDDLPSVAVDQVMEKSHEQRTPWVIEGGGRVDAALSKARVWEEELIFFTLDEEHGTVEREVEIDIQGDGSMRRAVRDIIDGGSSYFVLVFAQLGAGNPYDVQVFTIEKDLLDTADTPVPLHGPVFTLPEAYRYKNSHWDGTTLLVLWEKEPLGDGSGNIYLTEIECRAK